MSSLPIRTPDTNPLYSISTFSSILRSSLNILHKYCNYAESSQGDFKNPCSMFQVTKCQCQIVNLGAGFDTTYWNLKDKGLVARNFIEVDFQTVTSRKCYYVKSRKQLLDKLVSEGK